MKIAEIPKTSQPGQSVSWALGPGSVSWRLMSDPAVWVVGQLRTALLTLLHPPFAASAEHSSFMSNPQKRLKGVVMFAYMAHYGTLEEAERVAHMVRNRHSQVTGIEPITRRPYHSNAEYELVLTHVLQTESFLATYEELHGRLSDAERDQYVLEQRLLNAMIGINPAHAPTSYAELLEFFSAARDRFAVGKAGRISLSRYDNQPYPKGSVTGDLPFVKRMIAISAARMIADMGLLTLDESTRIIMAINRKPILRRKWAVKASMRLLSRFMRSRRGQRVWAKFLQDKCYGIYTRAMELERSPEAARYRASFQVPDANVFYHELSDLKRNWPGSAANYALGSDLDGEIVLDMPSSWDEAQEKHTA